MKKRHYKIKYGYDKTSFAIVVEGPDLERAIYAWIEQLPVTLGDKMIHGKSIIAIEPYYHAHTGWYDWYQPTDGEDWKQIERDCPDYGGVIESYKNQIVEMIQSGKREMIGRGLITPETKILENPVTKTMYQIEDGKIQKI